MTPSLSQTQLEPIIAEALRQLFEKDRHLLDVDANERSISHRLALYLWQALPLWDVDCEYNRDGLEVKKTMLQAENVSTDDEYAQTVFPDIIIHHRKTPENLLARTTENLLAIEIKKSSSIVKPKRDRLKLLSYLRKPLCYQHALFLTLRTDEKQKEPYILKWLRDEKQ